MVEQLERLLPGLYDGEPQLVHVDYFPGNVMAERIGDTGRFRISGVFDFAAHSLFGDPLLDVVGAIVMADMFTDVSETEQAGMTERARSRACRPAAASIAALLSARVLRSGVGRRHSSCIRNTLGTTSRTRSSRSGRWWWPAAGPRARRGTR